MSLYWKLPPLSLIINFVSHLLRSVLPKLLIKLNLVGVDISIGYWNKKLDNTNYSVSIYVKMFDRQFKTKKKHIESYDIK